MKDQDEPENEGPRPPDHDPDLGTRSLPWGLTFLIIISLMYFFNQGNKFQPTISYSQFKDFVHQNKVERITIKGQNIIGNFQEPLTITSKGRTLQTPHFQTTLPTIDDPNLMKMLEEKGVELTGQEDKESLPMVLLVNLLPWILIIGFFLWSSKKLSKGLPPLGGKGMFPFNKPNKKYEKKLGATTFADVAGCENAKYDLQEIVEFLKTPDKFTSIGATLPKGVLLVGSPGTGKTLLARATAGEAEVPFFSINGSEFIEVFVGVGASRVRDLFGEAKKNSPSIIFIDEIDAIGRARGTGMGGGHDEREQTLNQILSEMDGFDQENPIIVMAATNRPDILDPALIRPGRFDRHVTLELPHLEAREAILTLHLGHIKYDKKIDIKRVAQGIVGFSGADIKNLVNEAALLGARNNKKKIAEEELDLARDKIIMGSQREEHLTEEDKKVVAYHESGHALMAWLHPDADSVRKITIVPRGRALGFTEQLSEKERYNPTKHYLEAQLAILLGGRIAEEIIFDDVTTGAEDDLKRATRLARKMVANYGMSDSLGLLSFRQGEEHHFLGREIVQDKDFSEKTAELIDEEVQKIISKKREEVTHTLQTHLEQLKKLALALIEKETINGTEIEDIIQIPKQISSDTDNK